MEAGQEAAILIDNIDERNAVIAGLEEELANL